MQAKTTLPHLGGGEIWQCVNCHIAVFDQITNFTSTSLNLS